MGTKSQKIHLIAACGTGMGSLAGLLSEAGHKVTGSDASVYPPMSTQLEQLGIKLYEGYRAKNLTTEWPEGPDLVVVGNAIPKDNPEAAALLEKKIKYSSMPEVLSNYFLQDKESLVVVGTHGKTTTASLLAWILKDAGFDAGFFIGGVLNNFGKSYHQGSGSHFVIEGDEYDTAFFDKGPKFLHYRPNKVILGAVEFDHADIYKDLSHVLSSFEKLIEIIPKEGFLAVSADNENALQLASKCKGKLLHYGVGSSKQSKASELRAEDVDLGIDSSAFDLIYHGKTLGRISSPMSGLHNIQNLLGVIAVLLDLGLAVSQIQKGLDSFKGIKRRQELRGEVGEVLVIDDFAHHPSAVKGTIEAIRARYPKHALWAVFEPRSNTSQRNIFQDSFAASFQSADKVIISGLGRAEKIPKEQRLDPETLCSQIQIESEGKIEANYIHSVDGIVEHLTSQIQGPSVILVMSNGGFGDIHRKLLEALREKNS